MTLQRLVACTLVVLWAAAVGVSHVRPVSAQARLVHAGGRRIVAVAGAGNGFRAMPAGDTAAPPGHTAQEDPRATRVHSPRVVQHESFPGHRRQQQPQQTATAAAMPASVGGSGVRVGVASRTAATQDVSFAFQGGFSAFDAQSERYELARANAEAAAAAQRRAITDDDFTNVFGADRTDERIDAHLDSLLQASTQRHGRDPFTPPSVGSTQAATPAPVPPPPGNTPGSRVDAVGTPRDTGARRTKRKRKRGPKAAPASTPPQRSAASLPEHRLHAAQQQSKTTLRDGGPPQQQQQQQQHQRQRQQRQRQAQGQRQQRQRQQRQEQQAERTSGGHDGEAVIVDAVPHRMAQSLDGLARHLGVPPGSADTTGAGISAISFYSGDMMRDITTSFDYLAGVAKRAQHPEFREVEIVALFQPRGGVEVVRRELEAEIVRVGHDTLDAWPKWSQLGNTWRATGNVYRALQCFRKALSIKPTDPDVLLNMAVVLQNLRYLFDAETLIREAVRLHPRGVLHHFILGNILQLQGLDEEAIQSYERALELQPDFVPCERRLQELRPRSVPAVAAPPSTVTAYLLGSLGYIIGVVMVLVALWRHTYKDTAPVAAARNASGEKATRNGARQQSGAITQRRGRRRRR